MYFRPRPPSPLFARRGVRLPPEEPVREVESPMRLFPLDFAPSAPQGAHRTVNPLTHRPNALGQTMAQPQRNAPVHAPHMQMQNPPTPMHAPHAQMHPHPQQSPHHGPVRPEQAAEQFNRVNKGLPDGVHYEPLDEQTLKLLRDNGHLPQQPDNPTQTAKPAIPDRVEAVERPVRNQTPAPAIAPVQGVAPQKNDITEKIKQLIQDSYNAFNFYSQLAKTLDASGIYEDAIVVFKSMANDSTEQIQLYSDILRMQFGISFAPAEVDVKTNLPFNHALKLATLEENKMIQTLAGVLHEIDDIVIERKLQYIFNNKNVGFHRLLLLNV